MPKEASDELRERFRRHDLASWIGVNSIVGSDRQPMPSLLSLAASRHEVAKEMERETALSTRALWPLCPRPKDVQSRR